MQLGNLGILSNGKKRPDCNGTYPLYGGNGIIDFVGDFNSEDNTIIIGRVGVNCGSIEYSYEKCWISDNAIGLTINEGNYARYIYYVLKKMNLNRLSGGSAQPLMTQTMLKKIKVILPDLETQINTTRILDTFEELIELNTKQIFNIDEYLKLIFQKWFIEFNYPYADSKTDGIIEKNLPNGWKYEDLPKLCSVVDCLHSAKPNRIDIKNNNILLQLFNIKDYGVLDLTEKYYITDDDYKLWTSRIEVTTGDILITNAGRIGAMAQVPSNCKCAIGRNITAIRPVDIPPTYLYLYLNSSDCAKQIKKNTDQGSFFGSLNVRGIKQLKILVPSEEILNEFEKQARVLREKIELLNIENQKLIEIRELLIKKLIK